MSKTEPIIQKFMTYLPHSIESDKPVHEAQSLMSKHGIRHLPVLEKGEIIGVISDRDVKMAMGLIGSSPNLVLVNDICHDDPYMVSPESKLHDVASEMASKRYGSALVVQNGKLVGIFTTVDACKAICQILDTRFHQN